MRRPSGKSPVVSQFQLLEDRVLLAVDLQPYTPSGWSHEVVVSTQPGTNVDASAYTIGDYNYYLDAAFANMGTSDAPPFRSTLTLDGTYQVTSNSSSGLQSLHFGAIQDYQFNTGFLSAGTHSYVFNVDSANEVAESNEANNSYSRTITVGLPGSATSLTIPSADILSATTANWLTTPGSILPNVSQVYSFSLATASGLFLDLDSRDLASPLSTSLNAAMALYNSSGNLIASNDDGFDFQGFNTPSTVKNTATAAGFFDPAIYADLAAGSYFIAIAGVSGTAGDFKLRALADSNYSATVPVLNSNPGATDSLYLDFDGHSASDTWGAYSASPYTIDGSSATFSPGERLAIRNLWRITSEDYSPLNLNVTTVAPPSILDGQAYRMVATNSSPSMVGQSSGTLGVAYLGSYFNGSPTDNVGFLFHVQFDTFNGFGAGLNGKIMAGGLEEGDTVSHEFGHSLGLRHYNSSSGNFAGNADIIPNAIMATPKSGLGRALWSVGLADADSSATISQDDLTIIGNAGNSIGWRSDDYGNTSATATDLNLTGSSYLADGIIQSLSDTDYFRFYAGGSTRISVDVDDYINDLNAQLILYGSDGVTPIATSNPSGSFDASLTQTLTPGFYYVQVASHGSYGEIGQYSLRIDLTNTPPTITSNGGNSSAAISIPENTTAVTTVVASDPDVVTTLTYSIIGGADAARFTIDSSTGTLTFLSAPDFETPTDADLNNIFDVVVQASDGLLTDSQSITVTVTNINEAPTGTDKTITTREDDFYTFSPSDFGFADPDDSPHNAFLAVSITTLPTTASLALAGSPVLPGQFILVSDIPSLTYVPVSNGSGTSYDFFTFQIQDDGGTANGGIDLDQSPNTITIDVNAVNDVPVGTDNSVNILEDSAYTFSSADFGFTDPHDVPAGNFLAVIVYPPTMGILSYDGTPVVAATRILAADIDAGKLDFSPASNATSVSSFAFQVQDDGGTANGGLDLDPSPNTFSLNVTAVNDAPVTTDRTISIPEDTTYTFFLTDFPFSDPGDSPSNGLLTLFVTPTSAGSLTLDGSPVLSATPVSPVDISSGKLAYTPSSNAYGTAFATFTFTVQDNGGTENGGHDTSTLKRFTVDVSPVADSPSVTNAFTNEDIQSTTGLLISRSVFDGFEVGWFKITNITNGTLYLNNATTAIPDNSFITFAQANAGLKFTPTTNLNSAESSFNFQVQASLEASDDGLGGSIVTATITVNPINDAPVLNPNGKPLLTTITEDTLDANNPGTSISQILATMTNSGGGISDVDSGALQGIAVSMVDNSKGTWQFTTDNGTNWSDFDTPTASAARLLAANASTKIRFRPNPDANGTATFLFVAWDQTTGTNGGTAVITNRGGSKPYSLATETAAVSVTPVNDAPTLSNTTVGLSSLAAIPRNVADAFNPGTLVSQILTNFTNTGGVYADVDAGALAGIAVTAVDNSNGFWEFTIDNGSNWASFGSSSASAARLLAATAGTRMRFHPNVGFIGTATFLFVAWDRTTGTNGGTGIATNRGGIKPFSLASETGSISVFIANTAPTFNTGGNPTLVSIPRNTSDVDNSGTSITQIIANLTASGGSISDPDADALQGIAVTLVDNSHGTWQFTLNNGIDWINFGSPTAATSRLLASQAGTRVRFSPAIGYAGNSTFVFVAWDQTSGLNGGILSATSRGNATPFSSGYDTAVLTVT